MLCVALLALLLLWLCRWHGARSGRACCAMLACSNDDLQV
jgi:hypothetical protein